MECEDDVKLFLCSFLPIFGFIKFRNLFYWASRTKFIQESRTNISVGFHYKCNLYIFAATKFVCHNDTPFGEGAPVKTVNFMHPHVLSH